MLRKSKKNFNGAEATDTATTGSMSEKESYSSPTRANAEKTIIGEEISINGSIKGRGNLVIQGSIKGDIDLEKHHLTVGPNGKVEAEINAENITISGQLAGNINAHGKVEITKTAVFTGEIKAKRISVEDGAFLKAVIELQRQGKPPLAAKTSAPASKGINTEKGKPK